MTKEITKAFILQEIQDKFKLREFEHANFLFDETVIPVYNIEPHIKKMERISFAVSITSAAAFGFFLVPQDEQWELHRYNVIFETGVYTVAGVFVARPTAAEFTYLDLTAAQSVSYINDLPKDVILRTGDGIYINIDGWTSVGNLRLIAEVTKVTIR